MVDKLPACFLADLIHSQMATGNFGKMASAAVAFAESHGKREDAQLFRNMLQQVTDYYSQSDDGTIQITFRPE